MHNLIYYPGFKVRDNDWLKFALLYLNKLQPIIPSNVKVEHTDVSRKLKDETNLIVPHCPTYDEGDNATRDAVEQLEKVLQHPERYYRIFGKDDFIQRWKNPKSQTEKLFKEKYTDAWESCCTTNKIGRKSQGGLRIPKDILHLYMTILAQTISDANAISPITDLRTLDRFAIFTRRQTAPCSDTVDIAQGIFQLSLPKNLSEISVDAVIRHRNRKGFSEKQQAFHQELNAFMDKYYGDNTPKSFYKTLGSTWKDFSDDLMSIGTGATYFGLGVWLLINSGTALIGNTAKEIAVGISLTVGSIISIRNKWTHTQTKRYTRKFLSDLKTLSPATTD